MRRNTNTSLAFLFALVSAAAWAKPLVTSVTGSDVVGLFVGQWQGQVTGEETSLLPAIRGNQSQSAAWVLGERFVAGTNFNLKGGETARWVVGFDAQRNLFHQWFFNSSGETDFLGTWDASTRTMHWVASQLPTDAGTAEAWTKFPDNDHQQWRLIVHDDSGRALSTIGGTLERR